MRIETLIHGDDRLFVSISELMNEHKISNNEMISFASEKLTGVMALQLLESSLVAGFDHLLSAAQNALNAWRGGYAAARSLDVEILRFASGQNQIAVALETLGVQDTTSSVAAVIIGDNEASVKKQFDLILKRLGPEVLPSFALDEKKMELIMMHYVITEEEVAAVAASESLEEQFRALSGCVASRVSMVALES